MMMKLVEHLNALALNIKDSRNLMRKILWKEHAVEPAASQSRGFIVSKSPAFVERPVNPAPLIFEVKTNNILTRAIPRTMHFETSPNSFLKLAIGF